MKKAMVKKILRMAKGPVDGRAPSDPDECLKWLNGERRGNRMTGHQRNLLNLCGLARIVACNDDATKREKRGLIQLAYKVERAVLDAINAASAAK